MGGPGVVRAGSPITRSVILITIDPSLYSDSSMCPVYVWLYSDDSDSSNHCSAFLIVITIDYTIV